jgi:hypothetical protein
MGKNPVEQNWKGFNMGDLYKFTKSHCEEPIETRDKLRDVAIPPKFFGKARLLHRVYPARRREALTPRKRWRCGMA